MPKRIVGVSARLLDCAKEEFLSKGVQKASIRARAEKAGTSPRAVYTRFPDKEGLFAAIVDPAIEEFLGIFRSYSNSYWKEQNISGKAPIFSSESYKCYFLMLDYAYDHPDVFVLILKCSEGTRYSDFVEQLTIENCKYVEEYNRKQGTFASAFDTMMKLLHMLTHSFYAGLFEPLLHHMSRDEAHYYIEQLCIFFSNGVKGIIVPDPPAPVCLPTPQEADRTAVCAKALAGDCKLPKPCKMGDSV